MNTDILVRNINVPLLREQRDWLVELAGDLPQQNQEAEGIISVLDHMLDVAEGFSK